MLMYGKEASNLKQEIDRLHHTIPNQRNLIPKDKHCGNVHNRLWNHGNICGKIMTMNNSVNIWKHMCVYGNIFFKNLAN